MEFANRKGEQYEQYESLNERISETVIEERVLYIQESGIWEWR